MSVATETVNVTFQTAFGWAGRKTDSVDWVESTEWGQAYYVPGELVDYLKEYVNDDDTPKSAATALLQSHVGHAVHKVAATMGVSFYKLARCVACVALGERALSL